MLGTAFWYIADAFFIARISLAAAIAPGEAAFGGAAACCAAAGNAAIARASARPAAGKILKTLFIPFLLGKLRRHCRSTTRIPCAPARMAVLARPMNSPCSTTPVAGHPRCAEMGVDNPVAAIGDKNVAIPWPFGPPFARIRHIPQTPWLASLPSHGQQSAEEWLRLAAYWQSWLGMWNGGPLMGLIDRNQSGLAGRLI